MSAPGRNEFTPEQRATLASQLGDAKPAYNSLLESFGKSVAEMRDHDHTAQREDWFCLNLAAYMGERMAPVLRRLLNAEAEADRLRTELSARATRAQMLREAADDLESHALGEQLAYAAAYLRRKADAAEVSDRLRRMADVAERGDGEKDTREPGESTPNSPRDTAESARAERSADRLRAFLAPSDTGSGEGR